MNYNIKIDLEQLPGAAVKELTGKSGAVKRCVIIPVDNNLGVVQDSYEAYDKQVGHEVLVPCKSTYLNLTAFEWTDGAEKHFGQSHRIKASYSKKVFEHMSEDDARKKPIIGSMKSWAIREQTPAAVQEKKAESLNPDEVNDLPF